MAPIGSPRSPDLIGHGRASAGSSMDRPGKRLKGETNAMILNTTRRRVLLAGTAAGATIAMPWIAKAAPEFSLKYANNSPVTHPLTVRTMEAMERIKKETNGRVEIQVFPNNQLGSDTDMLSQLRSGALEFFTLSGLILSTLVPAASINGLGFIWESYDKVWPAMDGDLGAYIRGQIAKSGLVAMEKQYDNGYRQITSSTKPIKSPDDLKGFKIRVPPSPLWTSMFKAFDASPMSINFSEVYSALQTKVAEGQENPLSIIFFAKLFEVQKYLSETNHMWDGFWFLANGKMWNGLPADVRDIIAKNLNQSAIVQREDIAKQNATFKADLTAKGMEFISVDTKPFRAKLQAAGFYKEWKAKYGDEAWAVLEKYTGAIS
jgi:TRAP-type transport system periplasmic protein